MDSKVIRAPSLKRGKNDGGLNERVSGVKCRLTNRWWWWCYRRYYKIEPRVWCDNLTLFICQRLLPCRGLWSNRIDRPGGVFFKCQIECSRPICTAYIVCVLNNRTGKNTKKTTLNRVIEGVDIFVCCSFHGRQIRRKLDRKWLFTLLFLARLLLVRRKTSTHLSFVQF